MGVEVTVAERLSSAITLRAADTAASAPSAPLYIPCLKYGTIRVVRCKLGVEQSRTYS